MQATAGRGAPVDPSLAWSEKLLVQVGGAGTVAAAGVVGPRLLADRLGLTNGLAQVVENDNPIWPHCDGLIWPHLGSCGDGC